ncbi:hypothetical protein [Rhodococcus jostii]|uniref:Uncharacterized protein n=1 Tax=Rhodococcus jostii TaxID=132919 RepID=A0ABU4CU98_RHOJO|nr:hypothetical protein [Rhodococcus jostii]MDV6286672.1 hypothetical protein [Rhodococcus jostii]
MNTAGEPFFSWTARRVTLPRTLVSVVSAGGDGAGEKYSGITLDVTVPLAARTGRLLACRDAEWDTELVVLMVGDVIGADDVPVRVVDEEAVLIEGQHSTQPAEILVATTIIRDGCGTRRLSRRDVDHQLCTGGPVRDAIALSGAVSVDSEWCEPIAAHAAA